jgi:hypothetical protein
MERRRKWGRLSAKKAIEVAKWRIDTRAVNDPPQLKKMLALEIFIPH